MRVVIVEDLALLREGIIALLHENGLEVVAQAEDGPGLERIVAGHRPDVAIVDVRLPPSFTDEGLRAAIEARRRHPGRAAGVRRGRRGLPAQGTRRRSARFHRCRPARGERRDGA
jgi:DNA-binding NarL/FixJ family response regulator